MKTLTKLIAATALTSVLAAPVFAEKWDMPMAYPASNFHSEVGAEFGKCVTDGTSGDIEIVTHPSGSLFPGAQIKRAVQTGQVPIGERLMSAHQNDNVLFGFDSIPFLASSFDASGILWEVAKPAIEKALADENLTLLYTVPWPPQGLYFKDEVNSVADMKGMKFRSFNNITTRLAELMDMLPVTVEAAELSQALATGVANAMITSGATGYDSKVWESLNFYYEVDAWLPRNYIIVNSDVWADVSDANKAAIQTCAAAAETEGLQRSKDYTDFTLNGLREGGMYVGPPSEKLAADLKEVGEVLTDEWLKDAGEEGKAIVDAFHAKAD
ncbi:TRAP-type C4-dicarboxylate transport system, substrate-binding protein [Roseovarius lutimaris]|uniref:TRAP-type C4-dicarboxylate transport system, substrate-binding protein n=1 Tax=Roseovarius lutimaris TaxID=1005928 RepID=A0A1I5GWV5_9RHOB|nr:TRAP transporter substrate-binding protein [Roseovarius lutimaris]SFO40475.1 TRAP-type C4-dicarboxylate transport system, substrate-binding protein [Roseovarius lutimaris]